MKTFTITIDGKKCEANSEETILTVAEKNGIEIPTLCFMKETKPYTSCFLCAVEIQGRPNMAPSCSTLASPDIEVTTNSDMVRATRKTCLELLMSDHCGDCLAPCKAACPAGCDIPGFIHHLLNDEPDKALRLIKETIPMPASLGRVCPKPCEDACRRQLLDDPVSICFLKRYIADTDLDSGKAFVPNTAIETGKRVAIIGAGPAGISAAFYLRQAGHNVTIYDAHPKAGGMLRYGIPAYRLPRDLLDNEIGIVENMGVEFKQNTKYGKDFDFNGLKKDGVDSIFIAVGAQNASAMGIPGEEEGGALAGIDFLEDVSKGAEIELGNHVVVVGGGNTAIDAARSSLRMGVDKVTLLYRRTRNEMPANEIEIVEAEREGVDFNYLAAPTSMERTNEGIILKATKMELGEPDASGRRRPVPIEGSEFEILASTVISAIGQKVDISDYDMKNYNLTRWNTFDVNPLTFETNVKGVFAGGDCVTGADIAVRAIGVGKKAAVAINQYLSGDHVIGTPVEFDAKMDAAGQEVPRETLEDAVDTKRAKMPELEVKERIKSFEEVELGFDYKTALEEAKRCLSCGCSGEAECTVRKYATEYDIEPEKYVGSRRKFYTDESHPAISFESHKCILCGNCVRYFEEVKSNPILGFVNRGFDTVIRPPLGKRLADVYKDEDNSWVDLCPTGAFSRKGRFNF